MLGCRLNQAEIDQMARQFQAQGHTVVNSPDDADQIIINTCAVTQDAAHSSRKLIRQMHRSSPHASIFVTGCSAQIERAVVSSLPGVVGVIDNTNKDKLVEMVTHQPAPDYELEPIARSRVSSFSARTRAFLKVQDGCDNACTFCVTTIARGSGRSRSLTDIVREVQLLRELGYQEVVLTGVHLGSYGHDQNDVNGLLHLVRLLLAETDVPRLRLSSLEPWDLSPEFFDLWENPRLCRHLHLPLQSGCDATLRRMARRTSQREFAALLDEARARVPDMCVTSDVIVGFPGETDAEFVESFAFIKAMDFSGLHVFRYSKRPGTPAARMRQHVDETVKRARSALLHDYALTQEQRYVEMFVGDTLHVLWEQIAGASEKGFINVGYTDNYIRVRSQHPQILTQRITPARLEHYEHALHQMYVTPILD
jgi:threonylcarbamoyladenosine tRNA methylthiotransferase MtaB